MADSTLVGLKAIIGRLRGFAALTNIVPAAKIMSSIAQQTSFPYILVEFEGSPWMQDDDSNIQHKVTVHAFSDKNSPFVSMNAIKEVYNALDRQESNISVDSGIVVLCIYDGLRTTFKEPDGNIWHSVIEFKLLID